MDKHKRLEELRRQRDTIRNHLAWLEQEIAELADGDSDPNPDTPPVAPVTSAESERREDKPRAAASTQNAAPLPAAREDAPAEDAEGKIDQQLDRYRNSGQRSIQSAKVGCLLLFIACTALFLFLLFGLPYLLD